MAFLRYANATVIQPDVAMPAWDEVREKALSGGGSFSKKASLIIQKYDPKEYLLSHATIIASVDTEESGLPLGRQMIDGFEVDRRFGDYLITPNTQQFINSNHDSWERRLLLATYRTFIGGFNFVEHLQIPELSKGKIIDAAARDLGDSVYVDILIATERKHKPLVLAIQSGQVQTLSMGCQVGHTTCTKCGNVAEDESQLCFPPGSRVLRPNGTYIPIENVVPGDMLVSHRGFQQPVSRVGVRNFEGSLRVLKVEGVPSELRSTPDHPYWVLRPSKECACGCGQPLRRTVEHERGDCKSFRRRFLPGHNSRVCNSNPSAPTNVVDLSSVLRPELEFVEAQDIRKGDYLAFPIPQGEVLTSDVTLESAKLVGYFAAEGSYIKREGKVVGVSFDFGSHERNTLVKDAEDLLLKVFGGKRRECKGLWRDLVAEFHVVPVSRKSTSKPISNEVSCPSCQAPSEYAFNASFKRGYNCYKCKVCGRCWVQGSCHDIIPRIYDNGSKCSVRLMNRRSAEFFLKHCGEYASCKQLSPEVMQWPVELQRQVLNGWLFGDGTQNADGVRGNTASYNLMCQMHVLAARCGMHPRRSIVFGGSAASIQDVVNGDGSVTLRDSRGWLPSFSVTCTDPKGFSGEARFEDCNTVRMTFEDGFKRVGNWFLYRVREVRDEQYCGPVHNIEVENDHSYVVDGVSVHNCPHIRYMKGQTYLDGLGNKRKIAELCGHRSDPKSVKFIEASWVANPAFKGAVLRSILSPTEVSLVKNKIQAAFSSPTQIADAGAFQRAARLLSAAEEDGGFDFGEGGEFGGAEKKEEKKTDDPLEKAVGDLADFLKEKAVEKVRSQIGKGENPTLNENLNETLIKESFTKNSSWRELAKRVGSKIPNSKLAHKVLYGLLLHKHGGWRAIQASGRLNGTEILAVSRILDEITGASKIAGESRLYKTIVTVGGFSVYEDVNSYLAACRRVIGRDLKGSERDALIAKGRLYDLGS